MYTISWPSSTDADTDSLQRSDSASMSGCMRSGSLHDEMYAYPRSRTSGVSSNRRPSLRMYPRRSNVRSRRRAVARVRPVSRATSESVREGCSAEKHRSTDRPRSSDCTKSWSRSTGASASAPATGSVDTNFRPRVECSTIAQPYAIRTPRTSTRVQRMWARGNRGHRRRSGDRCRTRLSSGRSRATAKAPSS